tara:strand:+ start:1643 stop:2809 length:1167 start_codon:yes stop_codon:yes gene_type:complete
VSSGKKKGRFIVGSTQKSSGPKNKNGIRISKAGSSRVRDRFGRGAGKRVASSGGASGKNGSLKSNKKKNSNKDSLPSWNMDSRCRADMTNDDILKAYDFSHKNIIDLKNTGFNTPIEMSVLIPMFRARDIAWVAMESLCRQEGVYFNWELIIIEEDFDNPFGLKKLKEYCDRLQAAGCRRIKYVSLKKWIPLSAKWYFLIQESSRSSKFGAMSSADIYCGKNRLAYQHRALIESDKNWYKVMGNIGYDLGANRHVKIMVSKDRTDSCMQTACMSLLRRLPLDGVKINVDGWRYRTLEAGGINPFIEKSKNLMLSTVNIHGINNLSREGRVEAWMDRDECCGDLSDHIPEDVVSMLQETRKCMGNHKDLVEKSSIDLKKNHKTIRRKLK